MNNTQRNTNRTIATACIVIYIISLCLAYGQGGMQMAIFTATTVIGGWVVANLTSNN